MQPFYMLLSHPLVLLSVLQPRVEGLGQGPHLPAPHDVHHERAQIRTAACHPDDALCCFALVLQVTCQLTGCRCTGQDKSDCPRQGRIRVTALVKAG
eukprot:1158994-Pelagomonas_calceolata.AAC.5